MKNISMDQPADILKGPTLLIWTRDGDEIEIIKTLITLKEKTAKLYLKGGIFNGKIISSETLEEIGKLPSRKDLQKIIIGNLKSPFFKIIYSVKNPMTKIVNILNEIKLKKERKDGKE